MSELATPPLVDRIRTMLDVAGTLRREDDPLIAVAGERTAAILVELLIEIAPHEVDGPWQELT